jgi:ADP-heptose:LPS heptosyltransferase
MLGGNQEFEKEHCSQIEALSGGHLQNLCSRTTLKEYLYILAGATAVICVDGSASHLAQAFGRPVVTLFGPTQDQRWHHATPKHKCLAARHFNPDQKNDIAGLIPVTATLDALKCVLET